MQPELYENSVSEWLEANGTSIGHPAGDGRLIAFLDLNSLKAAIEELIDLRMGAVLPESAMKLYIWTGVLYDYSSGMIVALAPDLGAALELGRSTGSDAVAQDMGAKTPEVIELGRVRHEPKIWYVHGGG
jgi:hypothetical protein